MVFSFMKGLKGDTITNPSPRDGRAWMLRYSRSSTPTTPRSHHYKFFSGGCLKLTGGNKLLTIFGRVKYILYLWGGRGWEASTPQVKRNILSPTFGRLKSLLYICCMENIILIVTIAVMVLFVGGVMYFLINNMDDL